MLVVELSYELKTFLKIEIILLAVFMFLFVPHIKDFIKDRMNCTIKVNAKIADFSDKNGIYTGMTGQWHKHRTFPVIYEYEYNGEKYRCQSKVVFHKDKSRLNECVGIYINPNNPMNIDERVYSEVKILVVACVITCTVLSIFFWNFINS